MKEVEILIRVKIEENTPSGTVKKCSQACKSIHIVHGLYICQIWDELLGNSFGSRPWGPNRCQQCCVGEIEAANLRKEAAK